MTSWILESQSFDKAEVVLTIPAATAIAVGRSSSVPDLCNKSQRSGASKFAATMRLIFLGPCRAFIRGERQSTIFCADVLEVLPSTLEKAIRQRRSDVGVGFKVCGLSMPSNVAGIRYSIAFLTEFITARAR